MSDKELITQLKEQADTLDVKYSPNIGEEKLKERINDAIIKKAAQPVAKVVGAKETKEQKRARKRKEATELVRVRVTCFDPTMKKKSGTYIMASNNLIGTVRKFIQFNKPWFMPRILVNVMEESLYQGWVEGKTQFGITKMISTMEPRYNVAKLAQITPLELEGIKKRQIANSTLED